MKMHAFGQVLAIWFDRKPNQINLEFLCFKIVFAFDQVSWESWRLASWQEEAAVPGTPPALGQGNPSQIACTRSHWLQQNLLQARLSWTHSSNEDTSHNNSEGFARLWTTTAFSWWRSFCPSQASDDGKRAWPDDQWIWSFHGGLKAFQSVWEKNLQYY